MIKYKTPHIMTAHTNSASDMLEVETIRKVVKTINRNNKMQEEMQDYRYKSGWANNPATKLPRYRVKLQGRGPRTVHALADGKRPRAYDQYLPLRHAERVDVYIYQT